MDIELIKYNLIDRILATSNEKLLKAINSIIESNSNDEEGVYLSSEQVEMLEMSMKDIENDDIVSEADLKPFTIEELKGRIAKSEADFEAGRVISNEELLKEIEGWH